MDECTRWRGDTYAGREGASEGGRKGGSEGEREGAREKGSEEGERGTGRMQDGTGLECEVSAIRPTDLMLTITQ